MRFNDQYHKYSGVIVDIIYDHFLADNWRIYSQVDLSTFTNNLNDCLIANMHYLPADIQEFIPRFMKRKWLESYAKLEGIELVIQGMSEHTSLPDKTIDAIYILKNHYNTFADEFHEFFPLLIANVEERFGIAITQLPK